MFQGGSWAADHLTGWGQGVWNAITNVKTGLLTIFGNHNYTSDSDTEEDAETTQEYKTVVVYGEPLRKSKFIFVPEMTDFYSDEELNTVYHSADEYRNAVDKYGFIYKSKKFENADTAQKLLDYAADWIKNNYHGGITNFTITALDMHAIGQTDLDKYTVGRRVEVRYSDPAVGGRTSQTLTVISAEYDLQNPDKNQYKIGIPDVTLDKVYGETSKSGGGGGGGGKTSDETDDETNTELDGLDDLTDTLDRILDEKTWAHLITGLNTDDESGETILGKLLTPLERDPTSGYTFAMVADALRSTIVEGSKATFTRYFGTWFNATGGVDTDTLSANVSNTGETHADNIEVLEKTTTKELEASEKATTKDLSATGTADIKYLKVDGKNIRFAVAGGKPRLTIGGQTFTLEVADQ